MLTCKDLEATASRFLNSDISLWQRIRIRIHLFMCRNCRLYLKQIKTVMKTLSGLPNTETSDQQVKDILNKCKHHHH